jgi:transposase
MIEARGAKLLFLPPYSPDLNPIELCWAAVKKALRAAKARTFDALVEALRQALLAITPGLADGWFTHCGYCPAHVI